MKPITWSLTVWGFRTCQVSTKEFRESRRHYYSILKLQKLSTLKTCPPTLPLWFIMTRERRWSSRVFYRVLVENTSQLKQCPYILPRRSSVFSLRCPRFHLLPREQLPIFIRPRTWVRERLATLGPAWEPVLQGFETVVSTRWHQREPVLAPVVRAWPVLAELHVLLLIGLSACTSPRSGHFVVWCSA